MVRPLTALPVCCLVGTGMALQLFAEDAQMVEVSIQVISSLASPPPTPPGFPDISTIPGAGPSVSSFPPFVSATTVPAPPFPTSHILQNTTVTSTTTDTCITTTTTAATAPSFKSTIYPSGCATVGPDVTFVTETVTETDTITVSSGEAHMTEPPNIYMPMTPCDSATPAPPSGVPPRPSEGGSVVASMSTAFYSTPFSVRPIRTSTVRATVKTREIFTDSGPAITFKPDPTPPAHPNSPKPNHDGQTKTSVNLGDVITSAFGHRPTPVGANSGNGKDSSDRGAGSGGSQAQANINHVPVAVGPDGVRIGGNTYPAGGSSNNVQTVDGQTFTILPSSEGVIVPGGMTITAIPPGATGAVVPSYIAETIDGIQFDLGQSQAVVNGHTIPIGSGAAATSLVLNGETISFGSFGVGFPTTTLAPYSGDSTFTAGGATFSFGPGDVVVGGTTYALSQQTDIVVGSETVAIGTYGVALSGTTVAPPSATASNSDSGASTLGLRKAWWTIPLLALWTL